MGCLFCGNLEKNYKSDPGNDFICSRCVQMLTSADQAELKRAYNKAIEKGYLNKAKAIESFLIPEGFNVRETQKSKRNMVRKRPLRKTRLARYELRP
jgi:hypothetical protein